MKKQILIFFILLLSALWMDLSPLELNHSEMIHVSIKGAVLQECNIELPLYSTIQVALEQVDLQKDADLSVINLNTILKDGDVITIPYQTSNDMKRISINTATLDELCTLDGIGESTANNIILYRENNGLFSTIEDLKNVKGVGEKKFEKIKERITL